jgi:hypothetical protein
MPWTAADSKKHSKLASKGKAARQWADIANSVLQRTGDDASAIKQASGVIKQQYGRYKRKDKSS